MPIRRSIGKRKRIWYHTHYGSVQNPPLSDQGVHGKTWPNGSALTYGNVPKARGEQIVLGWICYLPGTDQIGIWFATRLGIAKPMSMSADPLPKKKIPYLSATWAEDDTYKFLGIYPQTTASYRLHDKLVEAFADHHEIIL